jgi:hypothetical protein
MVQHGLPRLHFHFSMIDVTPMMFAVSWFMTLFSSLETLPLRTVMRLWDVVLAERWPAVFRIVLALLSECEIDMLQLDFAGAVEYLHKTLVEKAPCAERLLARARNYGAVDKRSLRALERQFDAMFPEEEDADAPRTEPAAGEACERAAGRSTSSARPARPPANGTDVVPPDVQGTERNGEHAK